MRRLIYISLCLTLLACSKRGRKKTGAEEATDNPATGTGTAAAPGSVTPKVSSTVQVISSESVMIRPEALAGSAKYSVRILDATCSKEVMNLGVQASPEFALPPAAYQKPLCMETTYYSPANKVMEVKLQPFKFQGPDPIKAVLAKDSQFIDFPDTPLATSYTYTVRDSVGNTVLADSTNQSHVDLNNSLTSGEYTMLVEALDANGKTLKVSNYQIKIADSGVDSLLALNLKFERQYYQTRSIKRVLLDSQLLVDDASLSINEIQVETDIFPSYSGAFAALLDAEDAMMRGILSYELSKARVMVSGISEQTYEVPVVVKDFSSFQTFPVSFPSQEYFKNGLEAWCSPYDKVVVSSGDQTLTSDFGIMILQ